MQAVQVDERIDMWERSNPTFKVLLFFAPAGSWSFDTGSEHGTNDDEQVHGTLRSQPRTGAVTGETLRRRPPLRVSRR